VVVHSYNPSTQEADAGGSPVPGQPGLTQSQRKKEIQLKPECKAFPGSHSSSPVLFLTHILSELVSPVPTSWLMCCSPQGLVHSGVLKMYRPCLLEPGPRTPVATGQKFPSKQVLFSKLA
jgi:hypothetical protein